MKKSAILFVVLAAFAATLVPLTACNDCDENGFPEAILPCNNRAIIRAKPADPAGPVNLETDGEPQLDAAEPTADALPTE
jgi:hypothetical protein